MTPSEILTRFEAALPTWQHLLNHTPQATFLGWIVLTAALLAAWIVSRPPCVA